MKNNNFSIHAAAVARGRLGGLAKSPAKTAAVRVNGKLGGRPRKQNPGQTGGGASAKTERD